MLADGLLDVPPADVARVGEAAQVRGQSNRVGPKRCACIIQMLPASRVGAPVQACPGSCRCDSLPVPRLGASPQLLFLDSHAGHAGREGGHVPLLDLHTLAACACVTVAAVGARSAIGGSELRAPAGLASGVATAVSLGS